MPFDMPTEQALAQIATTNPGFASALRQALSAGDQLAPLAAEVRRLRQELQQVALQAEKPKLTRPKFIEDIEGPRVPFDYVIQTTFAVAATAAATGSFTVSADGPFVVTERSAYWQVTTAGATNVGRFQPVSSLGAAVMQGAGVNIFPAGSVDFSFEVTVHGSGRNWQNIRIPGPAWGKVFDRPDYLGIAAFLPPSSSVTVGATPEFAIPTNSAGTLWIIFSGYHLIIPPGVEAAYFGI